MSPKLTSGMGLGIAYDKAKVVIVVSFVLVCMVYAVVIGVTGGVRLLLGGGFEGEREGTAKYDDCREVLWQKDRPWNDFFLAYTCAYTRNAAAVIIGGTCVRIEYASDGAACRIAHIYNRASDMNPPCPAGSWPDPNGTWCASLPK